MLPRFRFRTQLLWLGFLLFAFAAALAVNRLYQTARQEIVAQNERVLRQERAQILDRLHAYTEDVRRSTIAELASFHVDGLTPSLRKWDDKNELIIGTFQWDSAQGFLPTSPPSARAPAPAEVIRLWQDFRTWRAAHPKPTPCDTGQSGPYQTRVYSTLDNPAYPSPDLGYQSENLEILSHAGRPVDPWAGWAAHQTDPQLPWIIWYQAGPDDRVRGCYVDVKVILRQLRNQPIDTAYARPAIVDAPLSSAASHAVTEALGELPAHFLTLDPGDVLREKESSARLTALIAATLFALFILAGAALTWYTRRERHDAERKITFVAQVSHELRTPLTSIRMYADLLAQPELLDQKRLKFAQTIGRESTRLGTLVERLLTLNDLERGDKKLVCQPVDLNALIRETVDERSGSLQATGLTVETQLPDSAVAALSDYSTVKQALLNLLENAEKYARDGGLVRLKVLTDSDRLVVIEVADLGPGVPRSVRARLFEPFVQGGQTLTNKSPGVGLGLSIARGTLRRVGADLVLLETERGATFHLRLPRTREPAVSTL